MRKTRFFVWLTSYSGVAETLLQSKSLDVFILTPERRVISENPLGGPGLSNRRVQWSASYPVRAISCPAVPELGPGLSDH